MRRSSRSANSFANGSVGLVALVIGALVLAACGSASSSNPGKQSSPGSSSSSPSGQTAGSSSSSPSGQTAGSFAALDELQPAPTIPSLPAKPQPGKTVGFVWCTEPACYSTLASIDTALKAIGWKREMFTYDSTQGPTAFNTALEQAVQAKPDYLAMVEPYPISTVQQSLNAAKSAHIPMVEFADSAYDPSYFIGSEQGNLQYEAIGKAEAQIAEAVTPDPKIAVAVDPTLPPNMEQLAGAQAEVQKSGGTVGQVDVTLGQPSAEIAQAEVSYLQKNPQTEFMVATLDEYSSGLILALKQTGLASKVKVIIGTIDNTSDMSAVTSGQAVAGILVELQMSAWRGVDLMVRNSEGAAIPSALVNPPGWLQVVTSGNAASISSDRQAKGYEQAFLSAWGV
jgi:ABC-type sugar transport system substrate-binding protein